MFRQAIMLVLVATISGSCAGPKPADGVLTTIDYDVGDLISKLRTFPSLPRFSTGKLKGLEGIVRFIHQVQADADQRATSIVEINGKTLSVRGTREAHDAVADALAMLRRAMDVAVDAESGILAVDRAYYEKEIAPLFDKVGTRPLALTPDKAERLRKASRTDGKRKPRLLTAEPAQVLSRRRILTFEEVPHPGALPKPSVAFIGTRLEVQAKVSADRRFVRLLLTQHCTDLLGARKEPARNKDGDAITVAVPDLAETTTKTSITVGDGILVLIKPAGEVPGYDAKGPVPLFFVRPTVWIEAEEAERKKQQEKK